MNGIFFLLPFLAIVSFGLIQDSFADETVIGINYFDLTNPDGSHTWSTHHDYILDDGVYVPYIQNGLNIKSAIGDVSLNPDGSYTWNGKFDDKIVGKYADISDLTSWTYPTTLNNDIPDLSFSNNEFHSNKIKAGIGDMDYKYVFQNGVWKTELIVTNLSGLTTKVFGFDQIIDLNTDSIEIDGRIYNIDDFDGVVLNKLFLDHNEGKILNLMNGVNFDFDLGYENLYSVTIHDTGVNSSQLVFDYRTSAILLPNETLVIDPTFGYTVGTMIGAYSNTGCGGTGTNTGPYIGYSPGGPDCYTISPYWDITSIDDSATITNVNMRYDIIGISGAQTCDWISYEGTASTDSTATRFTDALSGTTFVTGDTNCSTVANNYVIDLGTSADTDLQNELSVDNEWAVGGSGTTKSGANSATFGTTIELEVTYTTTIPPDTITDLALDSVGLTTATLTFSQPNLNGETLVNYMLNMTTPQQGTLPTTFWMNTTSSPFSVTGLTSGTDYSASASMFSTGGGNWTQGITNILNFTTADGATTPTNLLATSSSISVIGLDWDDAPSYDNILGFRIFSESPTGNGWILEVNDTGISTSSYSDTGLAVKTQYNYMVAGINATGVGGNSTASSDYTWGVPDAPTLFTIITPTVSTLTLNWTSSIEYGYPVTGIEVWRDNILIATIGDLTTYLDSLLSAVTSYDYAVRSISSYGNSPFVNVTGTTVTSPPTSLTVLPDGVSTSNLNMTWVAPVPSTGVNGYLIEREAPVGGGFSTIVANTTTTDVTYQDTGLVINTYYNYRVSALTTDGASQVSNTYAQTTYHLPDAVTVLTATVDELITVDLAWDVPDTLYGYLDGYMINSTTPAGLPITIEVADTGNSLTTYTVTGLTAGDVYSFSVSAITIHGKNVTSPLTAIANATAFSSFVIGELALSTDTNPNVIPIMFALESVDADTQDLVVTYDSSYALACSLIEQTSNTNNTYTGLTENAISGSSVYSNFTINDFSNDAIDVYCWDTLDATTDGTYLISASGVGTDTFPLQDQVLNFTAGIYGTDGKFGSIDLVTLFIVILSMIGFNRTNPAVGVGLMAAFIGIATYYQLLTYQGTMVAGIALVIMVAIIQVRKQA